MPGCILHLIEPTNDTHTNYNRRSYIYQCNHLV